LKETLKLEENKYKHTDPTVEEMREDLKNLTFQLNQNEGKKKREYVWCTLFIIEGHHKIEFPLFAQYIRVGIMNLLSLGGPWCEI
jgi:hypothetical protein